MAAKLDIVGKTIARLTILESVGTNRHGSQIVLARCECGTEVRVLALKVNSGRTRSCGCLIRESMSAIGRTNRSHGQTGSRTWMSWQHMHQRCKSHPDYVGRGVVVCARWASFDNFLADMGERPTGKTLDRVDNDGGYGPGNCRWATPPEQSNNRRSTIPITHDGATMSLSMWASRLSIPRATLASRLKRGLSFADAVSGGAR